MASPLRFAALAVVPVLCSLLSGCGVGASVGASPSLAGNWNFQSATALSASGQIGHLGGVLLVSSGGAITGSLRTLPASGQDVASLCYSMANAISVTGSVSADKTLVLTSSDFGGNVLTVRGTYVEGEGKALPSLAKATFSISGPCGVAAQDVTAQQVPLLDGTYSGTATFGANIVPFTVTFSNASTPTATSPGSPFGRYTVTGYATFPADPCFRSTSTTKVVNSLNGFFGLGFYGNAFAAEWDDPITDTAVTVNGQSTDLASDAIIFNTMTLANPFPAYSQCNDNGTGIIYKQQ